MVEDHPELTSYLVAKSVADPEVVRPGGQKFDLKSFLGSEEFGRDFAGGSLLISRLCPVDYHRFHFPVEGVPTAPELINGALYSVSPIALRKNPARVDIANEESIPDEFREWPEPPPPRINRKAVLDALKAGREVPGAQIAQDERVEIRA